MKKTALILAISIGSGFSAHADEQASFPSLSGELAIELENDWTLDSDDKEAEINDFYPTLTLATKAAFTPELSVNLEATLEPVKDATNDRAFEDLGGYINILTADYDTNRFSVYAGKFTPNFGTAWFAAPGIYGVDLNEDYEYSEMIGVGGSLNFNAGGDHTLSASTFFADTTFLSDSAGTRRGPLELSDGGVANTEDLSSFAAALDGNFSTIEGFTYHLGFNALADGEDGNEYQYGYALGAQYGFNLNEDITLTPLAEYVFLNNNGGVDGDEAHYLTAAINLEYGGWATSLSYQNRDTETGSDDQNDYVADLTVSYAFENGIGVAGAWRQAEEEDADSSGLGLFLSYAIEF